MGSVACTDFLEVDATEMIFKRQDNLRSLWSCWIQNDSKSQPPRIPMGCSWFRPRDTVPAALVEVGNSNMSSCCVSKWFQGQPKTRIPIGCSWLLTPPKTLIDDNLVRGTVPTTLVERRREFQHEWCHHEQTRCLPWWTLCTYTNPLARTLDHIQKLDRLCPYCVSHWIKHVIKLQDDI